MYGWFDEPSEQTFLFFRHQNNDKLYKKLKPFMGRNIALFFLFFLSVCTFGQQVSPDEARQRAYRFLNSGTSVSRAPAKQPLKLALAEASAYYVFNIGGDNGFVIVSGEERTEDILGYTTSGTFDRKNAPDNLKWWLACYEEQIRQIQRTSSAHQSTPSAAPGERIEPLVKTEWDQGHPYNIKCPRVKNTPTYTGCVATAMAQLLNYHRWPNRQTSIIPRYTTSKHRITMEELPGTSFNWQLMKQQYKEGETGKSAEEVAKLMLYCGQAVQMDYGIDGSGAYVVEEAFVRYFGFGAGVSEERREDYLKDEWEALIYNELKERRPVLFTGGKLSGSHAFVCDGYDGNGKFHINWGWGGNGDGFFALSILNPSAKGAGGIEGSDGYTLSQTALIGLQTTPSEPKAIESLLKIRKADVYQKDYPRDRTEGSFRVRDLGCALLNPGTLMKSFEFAWAFCKEDGTQIKTFGQKPFTNLRPDYIVAAEADAEIGKDIAEGKYKFVAVCREQGKTEWKPCIDSDLYYFGVEITKNRLKLTPHNDNGTAMKVHSVAFSSPMSENLPVEVKLNVENRGKTKNPTVYLFVDFWLYTAVASNVDPNTTGEVIMHFTPSSSGTHSIKICQDEKGKMVLHQENIVVGEGNAANLMVKPKVSNADETTKKLSGNTFRCHASIANLTRKDYKDDFSCILYKRVGDYGVPVDKKTVQLELSASKAVGLDFEFFDLEPGEEYFAGFTYMSRNLETEADVSDIYQVPTTDGITAITGNDADVSVAVYSLQGVLLDSVKRSSVSQYLHSLPRGIYIVDGKKVINP